MPAVSVIIPTYNYARFLPAAVDSVLQQTFADFELLIVDDGSTDDTRQVALPFLSDPRVRYLYQQNQGDAAARNAGIEASCGPYVAFLDADDTWLPDKLVRQVALLEQQPQISVVYTAIFVKQVDSAQQELSRYIMRRPALREPTLFEELLYHNVITGSHSSVMVRRAALDRVGRFDENLHTCDIDLWRRLAEHHEFGYLDEPLACVCRHSANISSDFAMMADNKCQYLEKLERELSPPYRHHLPRLAAAESTRLAVTGVRNGMPGLACRFGLKSLACLCRCPRTWLGVALPHLLRLPMAIWYGVRRTLGPRAAAPQSAWRRLRASGSSMPSAAHD